MKCLLTGRAQFTVVGRPAATLATDHWRIAIEMRRRIIDRRQIDNLLDNGRDDGRHRYRRHARFRERLNRRLSGKVCFEDWIDQA